MGIKINSLTGISCDTYNGILNPTCSRYLKRGEIKDAIQIS